MNIVEIATRMFSQDPLSKLALLPHPSLEYKESGRGIELRSLMWKHGITGADRWEFVANLEDAWTVAYSYDFDFERWLSTSETESELFFEAMLSRSSIPFVRNWQSCMLMFYPGYILAYLYCNGIKYEITCTPSFNLWGDS